MARPYGKPMQQRTKKPCIVRVARDLAVLGWRSLRAGKIRICAQEGWRLTMETETYAVFPCQVKHAAALGGVTKSPPSEAMPQWYQHASLSDRRGGQW